MKLASLFRQRFDVRRRVRRIAERMKIRVAGIVEKDDDDVRFPSSRLAEP
jgi:hypothetical protein